MILFTQKDFDRIDRHMARGQPDKIQRADGQPFGLRASITLEPGGKVWSAANGQDMAITLRVEGSRHGDVVVHCCTVAELADHCRRAGV